MDPSFRPPPTQSRPTPVAPPFSVADPRADPRTDPRADPRADPRQRADPRMKAQQAQQQSSSAATGRGPPPNVPTGIPNDATDNEKAQLIMQVLQLSDEQIAMLSAEQRASILVLKEQIAKSTPR